MIQTSHSQEESRAAVRITVEKGRGRKVKIAPICGGEEVLTFRISLKAIGICC
jgi:hypothetical protein